MLICSRAAVEQTISYLREAGKRQTECVVLWFGRRVGESIQVTEVYRPEQRVRRDRFLILAEEMQAIMGRLRERRLMIAAQVHSHPLEAFHSEADDEGAIVRHIGALSFVLPWFAAQTNTGSFLNDVAVYQLEEGDCWARVSPETVEEVCSIQS